MSETDKHHDGTRCSNCANWNAYAEEGGFAPCDEGANPEAVRARGRKQVAMIVTGGAMLTRADHHCGRFAEVSKTVRERREAHQREATCQHPRESWYGSTKDGGTVPTCGVCHQPVSDNPVAALIDTVNRAVDTVLPVFDAASDLAPTITALVEAIASTKEDGRWIDVATGEPGIGSDSPECEQGRAFSRKRYARAKAAVEGFVAAMWASAPIRKPRPTIAELEAILSREGGQVELLPNGEVSASFPRESVGARGDFDLDGAGAPPPQVLHGDPTDDPTHVVRRLIDRLKDEVSWLGAAPVEDRDLVLANIGERARAVADAVEPARRRYWSRLKAERGPENAQRLAREVANAMGIPIIATDYTTIADVRDAFLSLFAWEELQANLPSALHKDVGFPHDPSLDTTSWKRPRAS